MSYSPGYRDIPSPTVIVSGAPWGGISAAGGASTAWESANRGIYVAQSIPVPVTVRRLLWINGATVSASYNVEVAIYADSGYAPGGRLVTTGSVAQGTASQAQWVSITATTLPPGLYWFFMSCSSASATFLTNTTTVVPPGQKLLKYQQASVAPGSSPATATPSVASSANFPNIGFSVVTTP